MPVQFYPSQTILEGRTDISEGVLEALFKGVSTRFGVQTGVGVSLGNGVSHMGQSGVRESRVKGACVKAVLKGGLSVVIARLTR